LYKKRETNVRYPLNMKREQTGRTFNTWAVTTMNAKNQHLHSGFYVVHSGKIDKNGIQINYTVYHSNKIIGFVAYEHDIRVLVRVHARIKGISDTNNTIDDGNERTVTGYIRVTDNFAGTQNDISKNVSTLRVDKRAHNNKVIATHNSSIQTKLDQIIVKVNKLDHKTDTKSVNRVKQLWALHSKLTGELL